MKKKPYIHVILIIAVMVIALVGGGYAGFKYFSSYELNSYYDTVTIKYKDDSYTNNINVKYVLTVEYNNADGTKGTSKIEVDNDLFDACRIGDSIELIRTDAIRKNDVKDTYFEIPSQDMVTMSE